jgi:hypothetical protein
MIRVMIPTAATLPTRLRNNTKAIKIPTSSNTDTVRSLVTAITNNNKDMASRWDMVNKRGTVANNTVNLELQVALRRAIAV